jgi:hypothetical protein
MNRAILSIAILLALSPLVTTASAQSAAARFHATYDYAYDARIPVGTRYWCVFPSVPGKWTVTLYARYRTGFMQAGYTPIATVTKPRNVTTGPQLHQLITVPAHMGRVLFLVAYLDNVQQFYRGYTDYNPYGWYIFGLLPPRQCLIAEIPADARPKDVADYQAMMLRQWTLPVR